jgi:hypothetical protein
VPDSTENKNTTQNLIMGILMVALTGGNVVYTGSTQTDPIEITAQIDKDVKELTHALDKLRENGSDGVKDLQVKMSEMKDQIFIMNLRGPEGTNIRLDDLEEAIKSIHVCTLPKE